MSIEDQIKKVFKKSWKIFSNQFVVMILGTLVALVLMIFIVTIPPLIYGLYYMGFLFSKGKKVKVGDVFEGFSYFFRSWGLAILLVLGIIGGLILLIIPGLLLIVVWQYAFAIMVSQKKGVVDSLKASYNLGKKNFAFSVVFLILMVIIGSIGGLTYVGVLLTTPFTILATVIAAEMLKGGKGVGKKKVKGKRR